MFELWLKQATGLSLWQSLFLIALCLLLAGLAMSIDYIEGDE